MEYEQTTDSEANLEIETKESKKIAQNDYVI